MKHDSYYEMIAHLLNLFKWGIFIKDEYEEEMKVLQRSFYVY